MGLKDARTAAIRKAAEARLASRGQRKQQDAMARRKMLKVQAAEKASFREDVVEAIIKVAFDDSE